MKYLAFSLLFMCFQLSGQAFLKGYVSGNECYNCDNFFKVNGRLFTGLEYNKNGVKKYIHYPFSVSNKGVIFTLSDLNGNKVVYDVRNISTNNTVTLMNTFLDNYLANINVTSEAVSENIQEIGTGGKTISYTLTGNASNLNFGGEVPTFVLLSSSTGYSVTGISIGQVDGTVLKIKNVGGNVFTFVQQSWLSSAGNRFNVEMKLHHLETVTLTYNAVSAVWELEKTGLYSARWNEASIEISTSQYFDSYIVNSGEMQLGGNVGLNISNVLTKVEIGDYGNNNGSNKLVLKDDVQTAYYGNSAGEGKFGINVESPVAALHVGGTVILGGVPEYTDNSDALLNGLQVGQLYRTGDVLKIVFEH